MRCKNCHTGMMDDDEFCPSCHTSVERATAAPPGLTGGAPSGMLMLLPIFGGLAGGLLYAALAGSGAAASGTSRSAGSSAASTIRWALGLLFLLGGGLFLVLAFVHINDTLSIAQREPTVATAAELRNRDYVEAPPKWVSYTFEESKPIGETVTRRRLGHGGEVPAKALLVRVENRWLVATVANGFEGNELVGRLLPIDAPVSQPLIDRARKQEANPKSVLPYEFNAVDGCASDQQQRYTAAGVIGAFGLAGFVLGFLLLFAGRRRQVA